MAAQELPPPLPLPRNANLPENFGQESGGRASKLLAADRLDPTRTSHHFMEDTINPKPFERKESLPGCVFFWTATVETPDTEEPKNLNNWA